MAELPQQIGKYQVRRSLGEGAMGIVYEGFDPDIERRVAIKVLRPQLALEENGEEFLQRFKREAQSAAKCNHQNIVAVLEYGQDGDMPFIVMEFVEGMSLEKLIRRQPTISLRKCLSITSQLLKALHTAHRLKIVHRDIKTANVMLLKDGSVKLADFGIARVSERPGLTMTGAIVGTPKYMAPEQMFGLKVDSRADLFSVAMVMVELLARLPTDLSIDRSPLPEINNLPPNNRIDYSVAYPTALVPVLTRGLAVKQEDRFQDARSFVQAIKEVVPKLKAAMSASIPPGTVANAAPPPPTLSQDEVDSMTQLLVEFVGPVAKNIMVAHGVENSTLEELASQISMEIPGAEERQAFLQRWEGISGTRIDASRISGIRSTGTGGQTEALDEGVLGQISAEYSGFMGPMAARLVRHHATGTNDIEELVNQLANEIPDHQDRQTFLDCCRRLRAATDTGSGS